ncbi:MAG: phosphoribosylformylglycinamidine cyclo-ligase [Candidatus Omnitrophica bacterium]|nr:phosphoribosylformylglycinamidine cyclo-ligase [Candidatus Omnitrophota bacterium]
MTYKRAGVDIDKANEFVKKITGIAEDTYSKDTLGTIGHFGSFYKGKFRGMKEPVLVSSTDGVGTKLLIAKETGKFDTIGIDLVAMCVNDIISCGARPLFFLDYFATGSIKANMAVNIIKGIAKGCKLAGCSLIGGETAEMPGLYGAGDFDLAGFCVGVVDRSRMLDGSKVKPGDRIIGLASTGVHSNGYSLVRKLFSKSEITKRYKDELLRPTAIYVKPLLGAMAKFDIKAVAHITGGGFYDNIPRVLPKGTAVSIDRGKWKVPAIFGTIREKSKLDNEQLYRTFNMGIGMVIIADKGDVTGVIDFLKGMEVKAWDIGEVIKWARREVII